MCHGDSNRRVHTDKHTNGQTDGHYQMYYLPCFAVDKNVFSMRIYVFSCYFQGGTFEYIMYYSGTCFWAILMSYSRSASGATTYANLNFCEPIDYYHFVMESIYVCLS